MKEDGYQFINTDGGRNPDPNINTNDDCILHYDFEENDGILSKIFLDIITIHK